MMTYWDFAHQNPALALAYALIAFLAVVVVGSLIVACRLAAPGTTSEENKALRYAARGPLSRCDNGKED